MKWIILPFPDSYFEETKYMSVKFYQFSCIREYYLTNSIGKCVLIVYNLSATFLPNLRLMRPLSLMFDLCLSVDNKKAVLLEKKEEERKKKERRKKKKKSSILVDVSIYM